MLKFPFSVNIGENHKYMVGVAHYHYFKVMETIRPGNVMVRAFALI